MLKTEIQTDPLSIGYANMTDQQAADSLNSPVRNVIGQASRTDFIRWSARHDSISKLEQDVGATKALSKAVLFMMQTDGVIDFTDPEITAMVDMLVTAGIFTQPEKDDLVSLATKTISRAQELGIPEVHAGHVNRVRNPQ